MELFETHAHLDYPDFAGDLEAVVEAARAAGISKIITIGTGLESSRRAVELAERFECVHAVVGLHPTYVEEEKGGWLEGIRELARHPKVAAIGETGLDYFGARYMSSAQGRFTSADAPFADQRPTRNCPSPYWRLTKSIRVHSAKSSSPLH